MSKKSVKLSKLEIGKMSVNLENKVEGILLGTIIGDALGTPFDGLSKGHISSIFKNITGYIDPAPAFKHKIECWKKPGLYSSISQMTIIISYLISSHKKIVERDFFEFFRCMPDVVESKYGIFRHPGPMERLFIERLRDESSSSNGGPFSYPCARIAAIISPFVIYSSIPMSRFINSIISISSMLNRDISSIAGALFFVTLLRRIINEINSFHSVNLITFATEVVSSLFEEIEMNKDRIFDIGIDTGSLLASIEEYRIILSNIGDIRSREDAEKEIYSYINTKLKSPVKRATVNKPQAIISYAIFLIFIHLEDPSNNLFIAAKEGGSTSILCALVGALSGAIFGTEWITKELVDGLVNKRRIVGIAEAISRRRLSNSLIKDFLKGEELLTIKELQEKNAKLKHSKPKDKIMKKIKGDKEKDLSKHVIESWTKIDKAKWRKKLERLK